MLVNIFLNRFSSITVQYRTDFQSGKSTHAQYDSLTAPMDRQEYYSLAQQTAIATAGFDLGECI